MRQRKVRADTRVLAEDLFGHGQVLDRQRLAVFTPPAGLGRLSRTLPLASIIFHHDARRFRSFH